MTVAVVAAMPEEFEALARRLGCRAPAAGESRSVAAEGGAWVMATLGEGGETSSRALRRLLGEHDLEAVIGIGVGGGLTAELAPGALVVARRVVESGGAAFDIPPSPWLDRGLAATGARGGTIVSSPVILTGTDAKRRLGQGLDGDGVVDLESAAWAAGCAAAEVPLVVAKAVCDPLEEDLPLDFEALRDEFGRVSRGRVVAAALLHPASWPALRRLERRVHSASGVLADWVEVVLRAADPPTVDAPS